MTQPSAKACPRCNAASVIEAETCITCGHVFRTKFVPVEDQTRLLSPPPVNVVPPPYNPPPQYGPPYQPQSPYQPQYQGYPSDRIQVIPGTHSPALALILSLFIFSVGGQFMNRQYIKAIVVLVLGMVAAVFTAGISLIPYYIFTVIDAYQIAARLNRGESVGQWQFF